MDHIAVSDIVEASSDDLAIAVATTTTVYSKSHPIKYASAMVLLYKADVTSGTADVDLYLEQGPDTPIGAVGSGEGEAGNETDGWVLVGSKIADITANDTWAYVTLSPVTLPYLRIKAIGQGSNPATCSIRLKLGVREAIN